MSDKSNHEPRAEKLTLPAKALDQHLVVLGKTGSGKSSVLRHLVEHLLSRGKRACVVDPKGDWWGLKTSADGRAGGFPVIAFGDFKNAKAGDVPVNDRSGRHVAELVATGNRPCVIGMRGWTHGAMVRFWIDFASTLFATNAGELYLVGDEFHNFAPKQWKGQADRETPVGVGLHWPNRLLSEGRGLGIVCLIASQRPQKVHNDTLTSCETLVAMRVVHAADRAAVKLWVDGNGDPEVGTKVMGSLAALERGEAWVWSPEIGFGPERLRFPMFTTFDSFAPPQLQRKVSQSGWAGVDLDAVREKLAEVIEQEKANDPREIRAELAKARAELAKARATSPAPAAPDERAIDRRVKAAVEAAIRVRDEDWETAFHTRFDTLKSNICGAVNLATEPKINPPPVDWARIGEARLATVSPPPAHTPTRRPPTPAAPRAITHASTGQLPRGESAADRVVASRDDLNGAERRILDAAAWWLTMGATDPGRDRIAIVAGYHPNTKGFVNALGSLRSAGLMSGNQVTEQGAALAQPPATPPTLADVHARLKEVLSGGQAKLFDLVVDAGGRIPRLALAEAAGKHPNTKGFVNDLGRLRSLGIVEYDRGDVVGTDLMYPTAQT